MVDLFKALFDWQELTTYGVDVIIYLFMALVGTLFFLLRLLLSLFLGADSDFDMDVDAVVDSDVSFSLFSTLSILAFFMGAGWMGLTSRVSWEGGHSGSAFAAVGFGAGMALLASGMMYGVKRMSLHAHYDVNTALGKTARVYLTIPPKGQGRGQIMTNVSGRSKVMFARSEAQEPIAAFAMVRILRVDDDETFVVEPES
ncbi:MAG: hypothetical protein GXY55_10015 [Phycisphaerae bacterium]|nr:hypothetical protein [Phycisphaerae bacterium]